ncbi:MAG: PAS domain S-box protein, partial [Actinobacteria bacterium]|nr:PAS domain S-box protein [Actinomycetota bacterium]NIX25129.1 PAS domain S-box protein [Actinomycetota bacterium]
MEETLFAHVPIGILVVAPTGVVKAANPAAAALFGYAPDELVGLDVDALVPSRHREAHVAHRAAYAEAPVARRMGGERVLTALRKDGSERAVEVGLAPAPDGPDVYVTLLDVSAREDVSQALIDAQKINKAGTWSYDPVSGVVRWTPELFRIFRLPVA